MKPYPLPDEDIQVPCFKEENGFYTNPRISRQMSKIKGKHTKPELLLRRALFANGIRFRVGDRSLPGRPDISIKKYKIALFVDGEFWHGHDWASRRERIHTNRDFWLPKIERNMQRDRQINTKLVSNGFTVLRFWQKEIEGSLGACLQAILEIIANRQEPAQFMPTELDEGVSMPK